MEISLLRTWRHLVGAHDEHRGHGLWLMLIDEDDHPMAGVLEVEATAAGTDNSLTTIVELVEKLTSPERPDFELDLTCMRSAEDVGKEMAEAVPGTNFE